MDGAGAYSRWENSECVEGREYKGARGEEEEMMVEPSRRLIAVEWGENKRFALQYVLVEIPRDLDIVELYIEYTVRWDRAEAELEERLKPEEESLDHINDFAKKYPEFKDFLIAKGAKAVSFERFNVEDEVPKIK